MSLRRAVAAPFRANGRDRLAESAFVVDLSLDRDWFSPDQAKRLIDVAASEGLVSREDGELVVAFDVDDVTIPEGFRPDESIIQERSTFQRAASASGWARATASMKTGMSGTVRMPTARTTRAGRKSTCPASPRRNERTKLCRTVAAVTSNSSRAK